MLLLFCSHFAWTVAQKILFVPKIDYFWNICASLDLGLEAYHIHCMVLVFFFLFGSIYMGFSQQFAKTLRVFFAWVFGCFYQPSWSSFTTYIFFSWGDFFFAFYSKTTPTNPFATFSSTLTSFKLASLMHSRTPTYYFSRGGFEYNINTQPFNHLHLSTKKKVSDTLNLFERFRISSSIICIQPSAYPFTIS